MNAKNKNKSQQRWGQQYRNVPTAAAAVADTLPVEVHIAMVEGVSPSGRDAINNALNLISLAAPKHTLAT